MLEPTLLALPRGRRAAGGCPLPSAAAAIGRAVEPRCCVANSAPRTWLAAGANVADGQGDALTGRTAA
jgi:hypothetical protein